MQCERCGVRESTIHLTAVAQGTASGTVHLCESCAETPRPVDPAEARALLALEASGRAVPPGLFARAAADLRARSAHHAQPLPPDVAAFAARHADPPAI